MIEVVRLGPQPWKNYHETIGLQVPNLVKVVDTNVSDIAAAMHFRAMAGTWQSLLGDALDTCQSLRPVGSSWSFSDIVRPDGTVLETAGNNRIFAVAADQVVPGSPLTDHRLVLAGGGTKIAELNHWLEAHGLSLRTSGAHNGQSLAGAMATGVHGSVVDYGPFHNQICGLHLVTGPDTSVWIEPASAPALAEDFALGFASEVIRDDNLFAATVVHLGGMGIVNAVLLNVAPMFLVEEIQQKIVIDRRWIDDLQEGRFEAIGARMQGCFTGHEDERPYYVEFILDPFHPFDRKAMIRLFYGISSKGAGTTPRDRDEPGGEVLNLIGLGVATTLAQHEDSDLDQIDVPGLTRTFFATRPIPTTMPPTRVISTWDQANGPAKKYPFPLFNAAFALPRARLAEALDVMLGVAAEAEHPSFVFTLRFTNKGHGALAFTRFDQNVVINLDGLRRPVCEAATARVAAQLKATGIPFSQHWGKQGEITKADVDRDFGAGVDAWKAARAQLVAPDVQAYLDSAALRSWGLT
jgi:hypothetical protein